MCGKELWKMIVCRIPSERQRRRPLGSMEKFAWITEAVIFLVVLETSYAVDCYTCSVDFRSQPFEQNNSCLFPTKDNERTTCSQVSRYCQGVITRINGVFVMLHRTCERDCQETCTEKGFGIETSECRYCCDKRPDCGMAGYKSSAHNPPAPPMLVFLLLLCGLMRRIRP